MKGTILLLGKKTCGFRERFRSGNFVGRRNAILVAVSVAAFGFWFGWPGISGSVGFVTLWLFGVIFALAVTPRFGEQAVGVAGAVVGWLLLGLAFLISGFGLGSDWGWWAASCGAAAIFVSWRFALREAVPFGILTVLAPGQMFFNLAFSYPLRLVSGELTALVLRMLGFAAEAVETEIVFENTSVVVTAACSGIEQFEAMLLICFCYVLYIHRRLWPAVFHYLLIIPAIVIANVERLVLTLLLYHFIGERALVDPAHTLLGWFMVATAFAVFYASGWLFQDGGLSPGGGKGGEEC